MNIKKHKVIFTILLVVLLSLLSCKAVITPFVPPNPYLTFYSDKEFTVTPYNGWSGGTKSALEFSTDKSNWKPLDKTKLETKTAVKSGDKYYLYFRGTDNNTMGTNYYYDETENKDYSNNWILTSSNVYCSGNIENLLDYKAVKNNNHPQIAKGCFASMFKNCDSLVSAPELSATTLPENCYKQMFIDCDSLVSAPELPALTLAENCYNHMFNGCTALVTAPELPATSLAELCYSNMFGECTALITAPKLPATTLAEDCYVGMFNNCTSLIQAPELPALTLVKNCYAYMFSNCTSLIQAPELPALTLVKNCYTGMFYECKTLTKAPELRATTLTPYCYFSMFNGCKKLNSVTCLASNTDATGCLLNWLTGTATNSKGILKIAAKKKDIWNNNSNIPSNWEIQEIY